MTKKWQDTCNCAAQFNSTWQRVDTKEEAGEYLIEVTASDDIEKICSDCGKEIARVMYFRNLFLERRMQKTNARLKPADKKETGILASKKFVCMHCGHEQYFKNVEFGEAKECPKCEGKMFERE